jgi:hypothetical protein
LAASAPLAAGPLKDQCDDGASALVFEAEAVPEAVAQTMEAELGVEARRLGLEACRASDTAPAVLARVRWGAEGVRLEASGHGRVLTRDVPLAADTEGDVLELALILGDLVREVVAPTEAPTKASRWSLGARAALDGYPSLGGWLWGGDLVGRAGFTILSVEASLWGRGAANTTAAQGAVGMASVGGGLSLLATALDEKAARIHAEVGVTAGALRLAGSSTGPAFGRVAWLGVVDARVGVVADLRVGPALLIVRGGMSVPLLGATGTADGQPVVGVGGVGFYATLGAGLGGGAP